MIYVVYGISDCPACLRVCADLMDGGYEYIFINCDFSKSYRHSIRDELNWPTFPIVLVKKAQETTVIGGSEQLKSYLQSISAV